MFAAVILCTAVIPGGIAWSRGVFYEKDLEKKLEARFNAKQTSTLQLRHDIQTRVGALNQLLLSSTDGEVRQDIDRVIELRNTLVADLSTRVPYSVNAFANSALNTFYWPMLYSCLLGISVILKPRGAAPSGVRRFLEPVLTGAGLYVLLELPAWVRAFPSRGEERSVYAFTQLDIDPPSFFYQELEVLGLMILVATIWGQWRAHLHDLRNALPVSVPDPRKELLSPARIEQVHGVFLHWQSVSALLGAFSLTLFLFYWRSISVLHDGRYILSAFVFHVLTILTWGAVSLPLLEVGRHWNHLKTRAIHQTLMSDDKADATFWLEAIQETRPFNTWNAVGVASIVMGALAAPLLHALFELG
ncbi:hypothetical protein D7W79_16625 [Corallococcus exercitus]|uniref:hypothetical protein n=1 Tax=Corallococcus exercitus TaxID=2316736 RepID=UPI000EB82893|nr:hypothetical protein [Corallococcus exercitus]RKG76908.1 hypothetical protein D7W79_16625 [Corallococcus exercitus]